MTKLTEILEQTLFNRIVLIGETEQTYTGYPQQLINELEQAINALVAEVIGEDERDTSAEDLRAGTFQRGQDKAISGRNQLRAEQRKRAGL